MEAEIFVSTLALIVSVLTAILTIFWNRKQNRITTRLTHLPSIAQLELSLATHPSALKCHGINEQQLIEKNITPDQLAYLIASFSLGRAIDEALSPTEKSPFSPGSYRYKMCQSDLTIRAWPFIDVLLDNHAYKERIRKTIDLVKERNEVIQTT